MLAARDITKKYGAFDLVLKVGHGNLTGVHQSDMLIENFPKRDCPP
jgi:hypothetical protein